MGILQDANKWLASYERFLLKNASQISSIESGLRSLSLILPGQFKDAEVASESLTSMLQIVGLYHDSILSKAAKAIAMKDPQYKESQHNKYTNAQGEARRLYKLISLSLAVTRHTELLWEMVSKQKGIKTKWKTILSVETIKTILRLLLVFSTRRILLSPPIPEREFDPQDPEILKEKDIPDGHWYMPRTGVYIPSTPLDSKTYLTEKVLSAEDVCKPAELLHQIVSNKGLTAEVLYIIRPLIYAILAYKFRRRPRNWTPWVVGFLTEFYARRLNWENTVDTIGARNLTGLEKEEMKRRTSSLWWWMFRGAMYETSVKPTLHKIASKTEKLPIVSLVGTIMQDYLYLLDNYHFASSTL